MLKIIRIILVIFFTSIILFLMYNSFVEDGNFERYIYWFILIDLLYFIWQWRIGSKFCLNTSFVLFILAAAIVTFGFKEIGEFIMRVSFICLLIGFLQSLFEFKDKSIKEA